MLNFQQYLTEVIKLTNQKLVFNYNDNSTEEYLTTLFGKGRVTKEPFVKKTKDYTIYSVYKASNTEVLKALKGYTQREIPNTKKMEPYKAFLNRTSLYVYRLIRRINPDTILTPKSSSDLLHHLLQYLEPRLSGVKILEEVFVKNPSSAIQVSGEASEKIQKSLRYSLNKPNFQMKKILPKDRKYLSHIFRLELSDSLIRKHLENKRILVLDDMLTSGESIFQMISTLPETKSFVAAITLFKSFQ